MRTRSISAPTATFTLRLTDEERSLFQKAAELSDRSTGRLIAHLAKPGAQAIIAQAEAEEAAIPHN